MRERKIILTLLVSWIGIDTHGPTSAYIVGDSRFNWGGTKHFDFGKKVFASSTYPEIFGYAGDVLFPSIILSQIVEMINTNILFNEDMSCDQKNKAVVEKLRHTFSKYPIEHSAGIIQILHISRDTEFKKYPNFYCYFIEWSIVTGWKVLKKDIPSSSDILYILGSGQEEFVSNYSRYQSGSNKDTSRNIFHCFIDTLFNIKDINCGGSPQLVGIYRKPKSSSINYGIIYQNKRYFLGAEVPVAAYFDKIEWRNEFFELCDGSRKRIKEGAAKQPDLLRRN